MQTKPKNKTEFIPYFKWSYLHPRYWGIWFGIGFLVLVALIPARIRNPLLSVVAHKAGHYARSARRRARINLHYCMPELEPARRETLIDTMFCVAIQSMVLLVEQAIRSPKHLQKRVRWHGLEHFTEVQKKGKKVILLVPHTWTVDLPGTLLAIQGHPIAAMFHHQGNELVNWLWNRLRLRFGGRIHARDDGVRPFIQSVRSGYIGYYLPDQDHGAEQSEFVDFFATYKATLPAVGRLMKVCDAEVIPLFSVYRGNEDILDIYFNPPMSDIVNADMPTIARRMNEEIEKFVTLYPEQYAWILRLLKTRKGDEIEPYKREDI